MKNFLRRHTFKFSVQSVLLLALLMTYIIHSFAFENQNLELIIGFINPIALICLSLFFIVMPFFLVSEKIFVYWLKRIASWYLPILLVLAFSSPALSGNIMAIERNVVILYGMVLLFLLTLVFIFVTRKTFA